MESNRLSDVDVLDDLSRDADRESNNFEDANDLNDLRADIFLSQRDDVTNLNIEADEGRGNDTDKFQHSRSVLLSPQFAEPDKSKNLSNVPLNDAIEDPDDHVRHEAGAQAALDLVANANKEVKMKEDESQCLRKKYEFEANSLRIEIQGQDKMSSDAEDLVVSQHDGDHVTSTIMIDRSKEADEANKFQLKYSPLLVHEKKNTENSIAALPPPFSTTVIVGSMNPMDDDSESDDSHDERDDASVSSCPPLQLNILKNEDDDVLEVDPAVASTLHVERLSEQDFKPKKVATKLIMNTSERKNASMDQFTGSRADETSKFDLSIGEEIRVADVAILKPSNSFSDIHKIAGGSDAGKVSADAAFGISYHGIRKNPDELQALKDASYSLPSGPSFPDEREFENEMALRSDLVFSIATNEEGSLNKLKDDDEFSFDANSGFSLSVLSETDVKACCDSLKAKQQKEEDQILKELKSATEKEKLNIERSNTLTSTQAVTVRAMTDSDTDTLSLTELHNIYKRGLGDQAVLMDEKDDLRKTEGAVGQSASVLGRIFSQDQVISQTIEEEADDNEKEKEEMAGDAKDGFDQRKISAGYLNDLTSTENNHVDGSAEWREVKLVQHGQLKDTFKAPKTSRSSETALLSYAEAATYYAESLDVMQHKDLITSEDFSPRSCMACLSRPRLTFEGSDQERDRVFCIAATALDSQNKIVIGMLQSIYKQITKSSRDVALIGKHWEDIGFQGTDPSTDLRGCGVLSLLQMLYLVETFPDLIRSFYALSQHLTRHFPFACVLINITLQCIVALRKGALYSECNKHTSVLSGMNRLYVALASQLHDAISTRLDEIPHIMKGVFDRGRTNPSKVIGEVFKGNSLRLSRPVAALKSDRKEPDGLLEFTEIGLQPTDEEK